MAPSIASVAASLLSLSLPTAAAASPRTVVSIDLGWRFYRGLPPAPGPCTTPFNQNYTGLQCDGLTAAPDAASADECAAACCADPSCQIWQWTTPGTGGGCWIGLIPQTPCNPSSIWTSFANSTRAGGVPPYAQTNYTDASWDVVDAPHDFIIAGANETQSPYSPDASQGQAFIPKTVGVYRKHFQLPAAWAGTHVEVYLEGMYASAQYYINGQPLATHSLGYTSAYFRLDNFSLVYGPGGGDNILAVFADAREDQCTGWWYEGGGLFRSAYLISSAPAAHVTPHGLWADISLSGEYVYPAAPADGVTVAAAGALAFADVESDGVGATDVLATFTLLEADGVTVAASAVAPKVTVSAGAPATASVSLSVPGAQCWSVARPYLYTLTVSLAAAAAPAVPLDAVNATVGVRDVRWDADQGAFVNEQRVRFRAFCDHESFAAVGMAVPPRLNLFRFQAMRGMGGNGRRFSHNPPSPVLLQLADRLGVMTLDENRVFSPGLAPNMVDLVTRDRNHPSPGCNFDNKTAPQQPTQDFKTAVELNDGTRAVTGNMCIDWGSCPAMSQYLEGLPMSFQLDVQGFSHVDADAFARYHARWPAKPLAATECCSCETQRGEDADIPYNTSLVYYPNFNADCVSQQTQWGLALDYVAGSFVWTAFDYIGEPDKWPHVSSSFGSYDLSGFPKAAVWWYRSWWLGNISTTAADRPPLPAATTATFIHIVEGWRANPSAPAANRSVNVYSNAPLVLLRVNGVAAMAAPAPMPAQGWVRVSVPFAAGSISAQALAADGVTVLASDAKASWGPPAAIRLTVDAPSPASGTGGALYLDGADAALVRATIVDAAGNVCEDATDTVTFSVTGGPARVWGTHNGDPAFQGPPHAPAAPAYHGLVRAVLRVTQVSAVATEAGGGGDVALLALVNVEAGAGAAGGSAPIVPLPDGAVPPPVQLQASAPGLASASVSIATSVDFADSVLQVAAANIANAYIGA